MLLLCSEQHGCVWNVHWYAGPVRAAVLCEWRMRHVLLEKTDHSKSCFTPNTEVQHSSVNGLCYPSQAVIKWSVGIRVAHKRQQRVPEGLWLCSFTFTEQTPWSDSILLNSSKAKPQTLKAASSQEHFFFISDCCLHCIDFVSMIRTEPQKWRWNGFLIDWAVKRKNTR